MERVKAVVSDTKFWIVAAALSALFALGTAVYAIMANVNIPETKGVSAISGRELKPSEESKKELRQIVDKEDIVVAITAVSVSLAKNERTPTFFYSDIPEFTTIYMDFFNNRKDPIRAFSSDPKYNGRATTIMNGNFDCREFKDTMAVQLYPAAEKYASWLCSMSVPTAFDTSGDFVGWIVLYLSRNPNIQDQKRLARLAVEASTSIYQRDIMTQPREQK